MLKTGKLRDHFIMSPVNLRFQPEQMIQKNCSAILFQPNELRDGLLRSCRCRAQAAICCGSGKQLQAAHRSLKVLSTDLPVRLEQGSRVRLTQQVGYDRRIACGNERSRREPFAAGVMEPPANAGGSSSSLERMVIIFRRE